MPLAARVGEGDGVATRVAVGSAGVGAGADVGDGVNGASEDVGETGAWLQLATSVPTSMKHITRCRLFSRAKTRERDMGHFLT